MHVGFGALHLGECRADAPAAQHIGRVMRACGDHARILGCARVLGWKRKLCTTIHNHSTPCHLVAACVQAGGANGCDDSRVPGPPSGVKALVINSTAVEVIQYRFAVHAVLTRWQAADLCRRPSVSSIGTCPWFPPGCQWDVRITSTRCPSAPLPLMALG